MIKQALLVAALIAPQINYAANSTDQNAGTCAMYLLIMGKSRGYQVTADQAIALADKESRAVAYGKMFLNRMQENRGNSTMMNALVVRGYQVAMI